MKNKNWIYGFFISCFGIFILVGSFNYKIDSLGILKDSTLDNVTKDLADGNIIAGLSNIDERIFRKKQIKYLKNDVEFIAIGSSRTMQLRKNMFLDDGINNFQNYSVSGASLEDYIALIQVHKNKFGKLPKNIILGLDAWIFNQNNGQTRYLSLVEEYNEFISILNNSSKQKINNDTSTRNNFLYFISIEYFKKNLKDFSKKEIFYIADNIEVDDNLRMPDGSIYYPYKSRFPDFKEVEKVAKSYTQGNVYSLENYKKLFNIELFENLIKYLLENNVNIYFYLTPYNPITYDILMQNEKYKIINQAEEYIINFSKQNNIKIVGSFNPHNYNLTNEDFFDGMHSLDIAYEKIFKNLLD
ncbi:MAG: hypothetical protein ACOX39_02705 [Arcobacteraceae bacterium]